MAVYEMSEEDIYYIVNEPLNSGPHKTRTQEMPRPLALLTVKIHLFPKKSELLFGRTPQI